MGKVVRGACGRANGEKVAVVWKAAGGYAMKGALK